MKKTKSVYILAAAAIFAIYGCGENSGNNGNADGAEASSEVSSGAGSAESSGAGSSASPATGSDASSSADSAASSGAGPAAGSAASSATDSISVLSTDLGFDPIAFVAKEGKIKNGEFFSGLLSRLGMSATDAYNLVESTSDVFNVKTLRAGQAFTAYYVGDTASGSEAASSGQPSDASSSSGPASSSDPAGSASSAPAGTLKYIVYEKDNVTRIVFDCTAPFSAREVAKPVSIEEKYADVTISTSLWNDMLSAGVSPLLVLTLSDIYAWTVDFFGLQKGDRFRVFYDQKLCDGQVVSIDTVRYAVFTHAGTDYPSIMFDQKDGGNIYWNREGESMRKAFLKAPLKYSRISSGFSYARRHPITRKVQPHTGVDYAAPAGTPVMTIGDGVVTSVKYEGAGGNTVRIKHNSVYSTAYLHLSRYASGLRAGQRVRQGDVIGYVGSTGRSTGPHLDFRVWKNGSPINPLKMDSPPAEPLKADFKAAFEATVSAYESRLSYQSAQTVLTHLFDHL